MDRLGRLLRPESVIFFHFGYHRYGCRTQSSVQADIRIDHPNAFRIYESFVLRSDLVSRILAARVACHEVLPILDIRKV